MHEHEFVPTGKYQSELHATTCMTCANTSWSLPGSAGCVCNSGFDVAQGSLSTNGQKNDSICSICPASTFWTSNMTRDIVNTRAKLGPFSFEYFFGALLSRRDTSALQAGVYPGATTCEPCASNASSLPGSDINGCYCNAGYQGDGFSSCSACEPGKYKNVGRNQTRFASLTCSGGCSCSPTADGRFGTITDGPNRYDANKECTWLISANQGRTDIFFKFLSFDSEPSLDTVTLKRCDSADCNTDGVDIIAIFSGADGSTVEVICWPTSFHLSPESHISCPLSVFLRPNFLLSAST